MLPHTKAMYEFLRGDGRLDEEPEGGYERSDDVSDPETRQYVTMKMKKKRQQMMLKQMLTDSGYGDLSKMVSIGKEEYELDHED